MVQKNNIKYELQHILSGTSSNSIRNSIKAVASYLRGSKEASGMAETDEKNRNNKEN